jgi:EmrB/QacA subfamily drug resistance transporter
VTDVSRAERAVGTITATGAAGPDDAGTEPKPLRWLVFATVGLAMLMNSIDSTSVATALSALQADLGTSLAWTSWTITIYAVGQILVLPLAGPLGDRFGSRRVFLLAVAAFTAASVLCGLSSSAPELIGGRLLQGLAAGALNPSATGIVSRAFGRDRDRAVALFGSVFPIGAILGPLVGGIILTVWSWRGIFFINVPIGILLLVVGRLLIRESPRVAAARVDVGGIARLTVLLLSGMVAITRLEAVGRGWTGPVSIAAAALLAVGAGWSLVRHLHRHPDPVIPPRLLTGERLGLLNVMNLLFGAAALGFSALVPHYAQIRYDIAPLAAGALLTVRAVFMMGSSGLAVGLLRRLGFRPLLLVGMGVITVSLVLTALPPLVGSPALWLSVAAAVMGLGMGLGAPASSNAGLHLVPDRIAAVAGLRLMFRQSGSIIAVSVVTAVTSASSDPAGANTLAFLGLAVVMAVAVGVATRIPNQRGRW